jgi:hypothetical protein
MEEDKDNLHMTIWRSLNGVEKKHKLPTNRFRKRGKHLQRYRTIKQENLAQTNDILGFE